MTQHAGGRATRVPRERSSERAHGARGTDDERSSGRGRHPTAGAAPDPSTGTTSVVNERDRVRTDGGDLRSTAVFLQDEPVARVWGSVGKQVASAMWERHFRLWPSHRLEAGFVVLRGDRMCGARSEQTASSAEAGLGRYSQECRQGASHRPANPSWSGASELEQRCCFVHRPRARHLGARASGPYLTVRDRPSVASARGTPAWRLEPTQPSAR